MFYCAVANVMNIEKLPDTYLHVPAFNSKYIGDEFLNSFSLIHFNCRSLSCNFDNLNVYLKSITHSFKIIGLTETWLKKSSPTDLYQRDGYQFITDVMRICILWYCMMTIWCDFFAVHIL